MEKLKILALGYARPGYGFGRVLESLFTALAPTCDIHQLEMAGAAGPGSPLWKTYNKTKEESFEHLYIKTMSEIDPDIVFILADLWQILTWLPFVASHKQKAKIVAYCPVDGKLETIPEIGHLSLLNKLIVYTRFAQYELEACFNSVVQQQGPATFPETVIIPHGIDRKIFHPVCPGNIAKSRLAARKRLFPQQPELWNNFIVLNANRNQVRKQLGVTLEAFQLFCCNKPPSVKLYLHTGIIDEGINVLGRAKKLGITSRVLLTQYTNKHPVVAGEQLNLIYNACDIGINTSGGEGWGLVSFEHAATCAPQVMAHYAANEELWAGKGITVTPTATTTMPFHNIQLCIASPEAFAQALNKLYYNPHVYSQTAARCF